MLRTQTTNEKLHGFCKLWNTVQYDDTIFKELTLKDGTPLIQLDVQIHIPILNVENHSLNPSINNKGNGVKMNIPFFFPHDLDDSYDTFDILDVMVSLIIDTLSIYCSLDAVTRYSAEQIIQDKNKRFIKQIGENSLSKILTKLNEPRILKREIMEVGLGGADSISLIHSPEKEVSIDEEKSHIAHKMRLTEYKCIASQDNLLTLFSPFSYSFIRQITYENNMTFSLLQSITDSSDIFFTFLKHVSTSYKELIFFPKNTLKLDQKQLTPIIKKTKLNKNFDKNKNIQTSFVQMMILNFFMLLKEELSTTHFSSLLRETSLPIEVLKDIHSCAYNKLPKTIILNLEKTLNSTIRIDEDFIMTNFPSKILMVDPDTISENSVSTDGYKEEIIKKFENLSKNYGTVKAKKPFNQLIQEAKSLMEQVQQSQLSNTIVSLYSHKCLLDVMGDVQSLKAHIEEIADNKEARDEALEFLLMDIKPDNIDDDFDAFSYHDKKLSPKNIDKFYRISENIDSFTQSISNKINEIWDEYEYKKVLSEIQSEDYYIKELRKDTCAFKRFEETIPKLIYAIIGYYFNFHSTQEIIYTLKNSNVPTIGETYSLLVEKMPLKFNHAYNSFTPTRSEFNDEEYKKFEKTLHVLCKNITK